MKIKLTIVFFILLVPILAAPINISGKFDIINKSWKEKFPILKVSLKKNGVSTFCDDKGNFVLGGETSVSNLNRLDVFNTTISNGRLVLDLPKDELVSIVLYSSTGRILFQQKEKLCKSGQCFFPKFNTFTSGLSHSLYLLHLTIGENTQIIKYRPNLHFNRSVGVDFPNIRKRTSVLDTLVFTKEDQVVAYVPITKFVDTLSSIHIHRLLIEGEFSDTFDIDTIKNSHSIKATISGAQPFLKDTVNLKYDTQTKIFRSDTLYYQVPSSVQTIDVTVLSKDLNGVLGLGTTRVFTSYNMAYLSLNSKGSLLKLEIYGNKRVLINGSGELRIRHNNPFFKTVRYQWDDPRTIGLDYDSNLKKISFDMSEFTKAEELEFLGILTDTSGKIDTAKFTVTVVDSAFNWKDKNTETPITLGTLKELIKTPSFYDKDYRPDIYDSLGARYHTFSGGFFDTFKGETQLQIALPQTELTVNGSSALFKLANLQGGNILAAMALGQEYLSFDLQFALSTAIAENYLGFAPHITSASESFWVTDRSFFLTGANAYPDFFPTQKEQLVNLKNGEAANMMDSIRVYYIGDSMMTLDGTHLVNGVLFEYLNALENYDLFNQSTNMYFDSALSNAAYPDLSLRLSLPLKRYGKYSFYMDSVANTLSKEQWATTALNKGVLDSLMKKSTYGLQIYDIIDTWVATSKASLSDRSISLLDTSFSRQQIKELFFGNEGTFLQQGDGGLLLHFSLGIEQREEVFYLLDQAFDILKGNAPGLEGTEYISLRYDFLSLIRCVKQYFPIERTSPQGIYIPPLIEKYSK